MHSVMQQRGGEDGSLVQTVHQNGEGKRIEVTLKVVGLSELLQI